MSSVPQPYAGSTQWSYDNLKLYCDSCVKPAPNGYVWLGWDSQGFSPGGCKQGVCASAPWP
jgi:hypothetical protein